VRGSSRSSALWRAGEAIPPAAALRSDDQERPRADSSESTVGTVSLRFVIGNQAHGSIGQAVGGNAGRLQRTLQWSKALRSSDRRRPEAGCGNTTHFDGKPANNGVREQTFGETASAD